MESYPVNYQEITSKFLLGHETCIDIKYSDIKTLSYKTATKVDISSTFIILFFSFYFHHFHFACFPIQFVRQLLNTEIYTELHNFYSFSLSLCCLSAFVVFTSIIVYYLLSVQFFAHYRCTIDVHLVVGSELSHTTR